jgi:type VI secretion system protein ImpF
MARGKTENVVTQSVLDRLFATDEVPATRAQSLRAFKDSLKRDVEWLLNARRPPIEQLQQYPLAASSVINYGLPDVNSLSASSGRDQHTLIVTIQKALRNYEPRIANAKVFLSRTELANRSLRFLVQGQIMLDPAPEEISFDTVLELTKGEYEVK